MFICQIKYKEKKILSASSSNHSTYVHQKDFSYMLEQIGVCCQRLEIVLGNIGLY